MFLERRLRKDHVFELLAYVAPKLSYQFLSEGFRKPSG